MSPRAPILALKDVKLADGPRMLFDGADLALEPRVRACLVGANGAGKSTLLRILAGETEPDGGERFAAPSARIVTVSQEPQIAGESLLDYACAGGAQPHEAAAALEAFGLAPGKGTDGLSGGEIRRAALARAFAEHPDVLLLDEPTNHLDIFAIEKLEAEISSSRAAALIVSHDRAFLERVTQRCFWLEDRKVRRLGSTKEIDIDVRIIASTNRELRTAIQNGEFREDLYFRLNVFEVALPPLRDRLEDIPLIAAALILELNRRHDCRISDLSPEVIAVFQRHNWPGNARELRNVLERAVILCGEGTILPKHLPPGFAGLPLLPPPEQGDTIVVRPGITAEDAERQLILMTLRHTGNNRTRAAAMLGLSVKTLFNKLKQYGTVQDEAE